MNWLWLNTPADLSAWETRAFSATADLGPQPGDKRDNHERVVAVEGPGLPDSNGPARHLANAILRFDVFPPGWLSCLMRRTPVEIGDTIGLCHPLVPGLRLFFAARVTERFEHADHKQWRCGFTYRTLEGHPACGEETFCVEKDLATGQITVALRSWSRPGIWIAKLTYPIMRSLQLRAARAALDNLQSIAHSEAQTDGRPPNFAAGRHLRTMLLGSPWL